MGGRGTAGTLESAVGPVPPGRMPGPMRPGYAGGRRHCAGSGAVRVARSRGGVCEGWDSLASWEATAVRRTGRPACAASFRGVRRPGHLSGRRWCQTSPPAQTRGFASLPFGRYAFSVSYGCYLGFALNPTGVWLGTIPVWRSTLIRRPAVSGSLRGGRPSLQTIPAVTKTGPGITVEDQMSVNNSNDYNDGAAAATTTALIVTALVVALVLVGYFAWYAPSQRTAGDRMAGVSPHQVAADRRDRPNARLPAAYRTISGSSELQTPETADPPPQWTRTQAELLPQLWRCS